MDAQGTRKGNFLKKFPLTPQKLPDMGIAEALRLLFLI